MLLQLIGSTWVYLGLLGSTWVYLGLLGSTWVYLGLLGSIYYYHGYYIQGLFPFTIIKRGKKQQAAIRNVELGI